jgi:hypothetical protein
VINFGFISAIMMQESAETQPEETSDDYPGGFIDYLGGIEIAVKFKTGKKALIFLLKQTQLEPGIV